MCAAAYMHKMADEILEETFATEEVSRVSLGSGKANDRPRLSAMILKKILQRRGVIFDHAIQAEEIGALLQLTGDLTEEELHCAKKSISVSGRLNAGTFPDTILHAQVSEGGRNDFSQGGFSVPGAESFVFDSEASFVERVDDNKDSVWLLSVIALDSRYTSKHGISANRMNSLVTDEVWGLLVDRYTPFGFKMGLINCYRLRSLCLDRGLIAADLILALPKGGDRIKDSVQYRAFPKQTISVSSAAITDIAMQQIHNWVSGALAERVRSVKVVDDIVPSSVDWHKSITEKRNLKRRWISWLTEKPQPIHVIWRYNKNPSADQIMTSDLSVRYPPLVLSALSVPFTGRVRFWVEESAVSHVPGSTSEDGSDVSQWPLLRDETSSIEQLLNHLNCPLNSTYLVLTPEAKCLGFGKNPGEYLGYPNLELYLRLLYPSVDDILLASFFLLNLLVLLNTAIRGGKIVAFVGRRWMGMPVSYTHEQLGLIQSFIHLARQGWTLHRPSRSERNISQSLSSNLPDRSGSRTESSANENKFSIGKQVTHWGKSSIVEFFSYNLFFLLTVLPVINALSLSYAACILNMLLCVLRTFVLLPPVVSLRLSITGGHFCWSRLVGVIVSYYIAVLISTAHVYFILLDAKPFNRFRQRTVSFLSSRRLSHVSPDELLARLTRSLLISDLEPRVEQTTSGLSGSSSSSPSEVDSVEYIAQDPMATSSRPSNPSLLTHTIEQIRLLRRLGRLHELLHENSHYLPANFVHPPEGAAFNPPERGDIGPNQRAAPAHIYTWQCSRLIQFGDDSTVQSDSRFEKSQICRQSCASNNTCPSRPSFASSVEAEYEAEDEEDVAVNSTAAPRQSQGHRVRRRRPLIALTQQSDLDGSSSEDSSQNSFNRNFDSSSEVKSFIGPSVDWPPWVIPCEECVVCWRVFRPGVRLGALPCGHGFHEACIRRWLDTGALDCPVCRWPAHAPHLRQQRQMIGQLLSAVQSTLNTNDSQRETTVDFPYHNRGALSQVS